MVALSAIASPLFVTPELGCAFSSLLQLRGPRLDCIEAPSDILKNVRSAIECATHNFGDVRCAKLSPRRFHSLHDLRNSHRPLRLYKNRHRIRPDRPRLLVVDSTDEVVGVDSQRIA